MLSKRKRAADVLDEKIIKCTMGYLRKRMSQENLDVVILLKLNWDLVTFVDKSKAIVQSKSSDDAGGV
ncbi:hypothetical protein F444_12228 [Phytophthora nicotianae P1976]|uniref:Uncharacterized protein n=1 Tax=Phytophthora nicotianae P1976 TaxID=1317066 RepID=A0A080ZXT4_PHYNI|nr:hypothetical protein F444_12228 [Phytophthora nicotianae P1976]